MKLHYIVAILSLLLTPACVATDYLTIFLGGQSNMDGYGYVAELPDNLKGKQDVMIFHGNGVFDNKPDGGIGIWAPLQPGHGVGFRTDGQRNIYSNRFGPELSFAQSLLQRFPGKKIALIKYAVGGTGLHLNTGYGNWSPDFREGLAMNQYDYALNTIRNAFASTDINNDGEPDTLTPAAIVWMQGEADAHSSEGAANAYFSNLTHLMGLLRAALRKDDIPVVIGKITDSEQGSEDIMPFIHQVHRAQQQFVAQDPCAAYMTKSSAYPYSPDDAWHYTSEGYVRMGEDFANALVPLLADCATKTVRPQ